jgi:outer membrane receptor protein involved in Fe transport
MNDDWYYNVYHDAYVDNLGYTVDNTDNEKGNRYQAPGEPTVMGAYFQDKIELQDLIVNAGIRFDYFDPNTEAPEDWDDIHLIANREIDRDASGFKKVDPYTYINPRLGFSFPVTDQTKFHAQYGKFTQHPVLSNLYLSDTALSADLTQGNATVSANPSLKPEETTQYEVGFTQQIGNSAALDITGYFKEVRNYTMMENRLDGHVNGNPQVWAQYQNGDFGIVKGLSFNLNMRRVKGIMTNVSYTVSFAEGTGSDAASNFNIAWIGDTYPTTINPLEYDQRHTGSVMVDYRSDKLSGLFADLGLNLLYQFGSGTAYTPAQVYSVVNDRDWLTPLASINSAYKPWTSTLDFKIDKGLNIAGYKTMVYLLVNNVLNTNNVDEVYAGSGEAGTDAWLNTSNGKDWVDGHGKGAEYYNAKISDPRNWDAPRQVRLGLTFGL